MLLLHPEEISSCRLDWITSDGEVVGLVRIVALNHPIQARESQLINLAPLGLDGVVFCSVAKLLRYKVFRMRPNA